MGNEFEMNETPTGREGASRERRARRSQTDKTRPTTTGGLDLTGFLPHKTAREKKSEARERSSEPRIRPAGTSRWATVLGLDVPLLLIVCTLTVIGLLMVNSASWAFSLYEYGSANVYFFRQLLWTVLGIVGMVSAALFNYHRLQKVAVPLLGFTIFSLIALLIVGSTTFNATRSFFGGSIQPSELAKLVIVIYLAVWLYARRDDLTDVSLGLLPLAVIIGLVGAFIALQPDLSAFLTVFALGGLMFFLAGGQYRQIAVVILVGAAVVLLVVGTNFFPSGKERILDFLAGLQNPMDSSEHVQNSLYAFLNGGWFGVGIGKGEWKLTLLPVPHTDSIFAVIGEETGFIGASIVVLLFALLIWRGLSIAQRAPDQLGMLLAAGLTFWISMEAIINMAVMLGLLPFAGNALPLISAGGSSRVVTLIAIGILLNISRLSEESHEIKERSYSAVVDLRRRDWRGSVSRARRTPDALRKS